MRSSPQKDSQRTWSDSALSGGTDGVSDPNALDETYTYDPWGNMQRQGSYNFIQPFSSNNQISASGYSYDASGDLLTDGIGDTYAYNAAGRMTASNGAQYVYDALGQMAAKIGGTNPTEVVYFGGRAIAFRDPSSGGYTDLIWAGGSLIADVAGIQTATPVYRLLNNVGTLAMTTDNSGNVTGTNVLTPYGNVLSSNATDPFPFAGLMADTNGTNIAQYRNYATAPARWLRPDPYNGSYDLANPQSFNRYMYVNGNPLAFTDPSGLDGCDTPNVPCIVFSFGFNGSGAGYVGPAYGNFVFSNMFSGSSLGSFFNNPLGSFGSGLLDAAGPVIGLGLFAANFLNDIFGWWGQGVQFNGNVAASQSGKNVPQISSASTNGTISSISRAACASMIADSEYSIAAHTSGASPDNPVVQALLGNGISGLYNLWNAPNVGAGLKALIVGGFNPGIPGGAQVLGYPIDSGLAGIATQGIIKGAMANVAQVSAETVGYAVGGAKFVYDFGTYLYAYARDCSQ